MLSWFRSRDPRARRKAPEAGDRAIGPADAARTAPCARTGTLPPLAATPRTRSHDLEWRLWVREAVFELDDEGYILSHSAGTCSALATLGDCSGTMLVDRLRASERVAFLHAVSRARAGESGVGCRVALRLDLAAREWTSVGMRLVPRGGGVLVLMSEDADAGHDEPLASTRPGGDGEAGLAEATIQPDTIQPDTIRPDTIQADVIRPGDPSAERDAELAHELRTPLNAVAGYAQALEAGLFGPLGERQRDAVAHIAEASEHLIEVANTILDSARFERGTDALDPVVAEPVAEIDRCCAMLSGIAARRDVVLANRVTARCGTARFDRAALRQIVVNLVSNAVKASGPGGVVSVQARRDDGMFALSVHDTGRGMDEGEIVRARHAFGRVTPCDGETTGGLGLGVVHRLVALHGGTFELTSRPGHGTIATVRLPDAEAGLGAAPVAPREQKASGEGDGRKAESAYRHIEPTDRHVEPANRHGALADRHGATEDPSEACRRAGVVPLGPFATVPPDRADNCNEGAAARRRVTR